MNVPRGYQALPPIEAGVLTRAAVAVTDEWGKEYSIWQGRVLSALIAQAPVLVQFAIDMPPEPPAWHTDPIYLAIGQVSHPQVFGWFRFKNAIPGQNATITTFTAHG